MSNLVLNSLTQESCSTLNGKTPALDASTAHKLGELVDGWQVNPESNSITKQFKFCNYYETIAFVNSVAGIAHQQDHHPTMNVSYNQCSITYKTHSVGGLSRNDFICAARINNLFS